MNEFEEMQEAFKNIFKEAQSVNNDIKDFQNGSKSFWKSGGHPLTIIKPLDSFHQDPAKAQEEAKIKKSNSMEEVRAYYMQFQAIENNLEQRITKTIEDNLG